MVGGYLVLTALAFAFPNRPAIWPLLALFHLGFGAILLTGRLGPLRRMARGADGADRPAWVRWAATVVADGYALLLLPFLYWELPLLNQAVWGGRYFDGVVQGWEHAMFGGEPAIEFSRKFATLWVSEPLHFAYFSYYFVLYVFPVVVWARKGRAAFLDTVFGMMLGFATHYAVFILFPVKGPYFLFPPPGEPMSSGPMYRTVQYLLGNGASSGTAFPSSHVAITAVQLTNAIRHMRAAVPIMVLALVGITLGTVYSGIHYGIDSAVGVVTGLAVGFLVPWARRKLA